MDPRLFVLALGAFAGTMESSVLPGLLPGISAETHVSMAQAGYLAFAYSVTYAIAAPVLSALFGAADRRKVLASAELIFALSAACIAIAPGLPLMIAARVCLACGAAMFTSMAQATAVAITPPERRGRAMALVLTGATLATAAGSPVGAWIAVQFNWRATIGLVALFGFIAAAILWLRLPSGLVGERRSFKERLGVLLLPGVPLALTASMLCALGAGCVAVYFAAITIDVVHVSAELVPLILLAYGFGSLAGGVIGGQLTDRLGAFRTTIVMLSITALTLAGISAMQLLPYWGMVVAWLFAVGIIGLVSWGMYTAQISLLASLAPKTVPLAVSLNLSAGSIGQALGALAGGLVLDHLGAGWLGGVGAVFVCGSLALFLANRRRFVVSLAPA